MTSDKLPAAQGLRERAEQLLQKHGIAGQTLSPEENQAVIHELQVHQIELELQNEELQRSQLELALALDKDQQDIKDVINEIFADVLQPKPEE